MNKTAMQKSDLVERAGVMLDQADKIGCKQFVTPKVNNNSKGTSDRETSLRYPLTGRQKWPREAELGVCGELVQHPPPP